MTLSTCDEIIELIPAFVLGALDADEAARVATHVAACPAAAPKQSRSVML